MVPTVGKIGVVSWVDSEPVDAVFSVCFDIPTDVVVELSISEPFVICVVPSVIFVLMFSDVDSLLPGPSERNVN